MGLAQIRRWFGPLPGRKEAETFSLMAIAVAVLVCALSLYLGFRGETLLGRPLGGDFVQFYVAGKILNHYDAWRIYDLKLAVDLQHAVLPAMSSTQMLVFAQAPYLALLFRPFALLPYTWAYVAWLVFSAALYTASLALLFRAAGLAPRDRKTAYLLAFSAMPFLFETWIGGQVSVLALFAWSLFFYIKHRNLRFLAGMTLALMLFKPTFVLLPAALLVLGRLWRITAGFLAGCTLVTGLSLAAAGLQGLRSWIDTLLYDSRFTQGAIPISHLAKNIDAHACLQLLTGATPVTTVLFVLGCAAAFLTLAVRWWRSPDSVANWAGMLALTLVISPYAPIYDTILLVPALVLLAGSLGRGPERDAFLGWLVLLYMLPWITQSFAQYLHLQLFTVALTGFGLWPLRSASPLSFNQIASKSRGILDLDSLKTAQEDRTMPNQTGHQSTGRF